MSNSSTQVQHYNPILVAIRDQLPRLWRHMVTAFDRLPRVHAAPYATRYLLPRPISTFLSATIPLFTYLAHLLNPTSAQTLPGGALRDHKHAVLAVRLRRPRRLPQPAAVLPRRRLQRRPGRRRLRRLVLRRLDRVVRDHRQGGLRGQARRYGQRRRGSSAATDDRGGGLGAGEAFGMGGYIYSRAPAPTWAGLRRGVATAGPARCRRLASALGRAWDGDSRIPDGRAVGWVAHFKSKMRWDWFIDSLCYQPASP